MTKKTSQPGELGAEAAELGAQAIKDQLADIRDQVEKQKIPLSKEVEAYTRENLRKVAGKLQAGEPVYPSDMEFIEKVKMWMWIPADLKERYKSIEKMDEETPEAQERHITSRQWFALLHIAGFKAEKGKEKEWIDREFKFTGHNKIEINDILRIEDCAGLMVLPDNLKVGWHLNLSGCSGLTSLPHNLYVVRDVYLMGCTGLKGLPGDLDAGSFERGTGFFLSEDVQEKVKEDAERLKKEGKIHGVVEYQ